MGSMTPGLVVLSYIRKQADKPTGHAYNYIVEFNLQCNRIKYIDVYICIHRSMYIIYFISIQW